MGRNLVNCIQPTTNLQVGEMDLTLQFDCFTNRKFVHTFILADISNPILHRWAQVR